MMVLLLLLLLVYMGVLRLLRLWMRLLVDLAFLLWHGKFGAAVGRRVGQVEAVGARHVELVVPLALEVGVEVRVEGEWLLLVHELVDLARWPRLQALVLLAVSAALLQSCIVEDACHRLNDERVLGARPCERPVVLRVAPRLQDAVPDRGAGVPAGQTLAAIVLVEDYFIWDYALASRKNARKLPCGLTLLGRVPLHNLLEGLAES